VDVEEFARLEESFRQFHAEFAPAFGRKQWRERGQDYLRGLLVQAAERGNAENLSEVTDASERVLQRFLSEAKWDEQAVLRKLQAYLGPRLAHPEAVWAVDESGFPKQGKKSVGVARQYCGALGKVAGCQIGVFLAHVGPRGRALVDHRLYLPREWTEDPERCAEAEVPADHREYQSKSALALALLQQAKEWGHLTAQWVTGDDEYGKSPEFRDGVAAAGWNYVLEVPGNTPVWPVETVWETPVARGRGRSPTARPVARERQEVRERAAAFPAAGWQEITVGEGAQGPRTYRFAFERIRESRDGKPGQELWLIHKQNLDGTEPRTFFSNAPAKTPPATLARVAMTRWPIETEFETEKSQVALDEYEVRRWPGWRHHITMCLLACAFLLTLQQEWGEKDARGHAAPSASHRLRTAAAQALDPRHSAAMVAPHASPERSRETIARAAAGATADGIMPALRPAQMKPSL
jgi:SRSO17 transposase